MPEEIYSTYSGISVVRIPLWWVGHIPRFLPSCTPKQLSYTYSIE